MGAAASSPTRDAPRKYAVPVSSPAAAAESAAEATAPTPLSAPVRGPGSAPALAATPVSHPTTLRVETGLLPKERRVKPALRDPRVVPARFVDFAELKDHGRLPRFGSNPKYTHPVTKEGNANMCHFREDFKMCTIFVFVSHFWGTEQEDEDVIAQQEVSGLPSEVRAAAANKKMSVNGERDWAKLSWSERKIKADAVDEHDLGKDMVMIKRLQKARAENRKQRAERAAKLHPDDEQRRKFHLIVSAIESLRGGPRAQIPDGTAVALWIDWCCINQDRRAESDKNVKREVRNLHKLIASCDLVLTIVVDPDHAAWSYPAVWAPHEGVSQAASLAASGGRATKVEEDEEDEEREEDEGPDERGTIFGLGNTKQKMPLFQYAAEEWPLYWSRAWCCTEQLLAASMPHQEPDRAIMVRGALANAIKLGRRARIVYGTKEQEEGLLPIHLPPFLKAVLDEWQPVLNGYIGKEADKKLVRDLEVEGKRALAITRYDTDGDGFLDAKELSVAYDAEEEGWAGGYSGKGDGFGRYVNPDGSWVEGSFVKSQLTGNGKSMDASGEIYEGEFGGHRRMLCPAYGSKYGQARILCGTREGVGTQLYPNGDLYEGEFVDSQREGKGVCIYARGDIYDGEWKGGGRSGKGKMVAKNGNVYEGQWEVSEGGEDGRHGRGKMTYASIDGSPPEVYNGTWKSDKRAGQGRYTYCDGSSYNGGWQDGVRHGRGKWLAAGASAVLQEYDADGSGCLDIDEFTQLAKRLHQLNGRDRSRAVPPEASTPAATTNAAPQLKDADVRAIFDSYDDNLDGQLDYKELRGALKALGGFEIDGEPMTFYEGEWTNDMRHGKGRHCEVGFEYEGQFERDMLHGTGIWRQVVVGEGKGLVHEGGFREGERHGPGTTRYPDGGVLEATWEHGAVKGQAHWVTPHGAVYDGEFVNDKREGEGTYSFAEDEEEGGVYVGSWKDGFAHGQGRRIFADGTMYEGEWRNGTMNGRGVQFLPSGLTYEGQFRASLKHGSGRQRKSPPAAEAIEDSLAAMKAIAHVRKARAIGVARREREAQIQRELAQLEKMDALKEARGSMTWTAEAERQATGDQSSQVATIQAGTSSVAKTMWKAVGTAFTTNATSMLESTIVEGPPNTRVALYSLLGMGYLVHEGQWVDDCAGKSEKLPSTFYQDVRASLGLEPWEFGAL